MWASCGKLRGGMDSSEYKDYILKLLFMKYVTNKFKNKGSYEDIKVFDKAHDKDSDSDKRTGCSFDNFIVLKGKKNIGEGMDKIIARLADENTDLKGIIDIAHFTRITGFIEDQTGVASNYCNYMNTQTKNPFEIEHIITDYYEWFTLEYADQEEFKRWRNSIGALLLLHKSINGSLNDSKYDYKLSKYCSNEGNIYTESLGEQAYQNNQKFKKFITDNKLGFKVYQQFGKNEITERIKLLI